LFNLFPVIPCPDFRVVISEKNEEIHFKAGILPYVCSFGNLKVELVGFLARRSRNNVKVRKTAI
jgi:hypothetical protein